MTWSPLLPLLARVEFESLLTLCGMIMEREKERKKARGKDDDA